jgi:hypothetical protein
MSETVAVFTYKSVDTIISDGGTQSWALDRNRAAKCKYVVMYRNAKKYTPEGPEEHARPFMVGTVKDVVPSTEIEGRWLIQIREYALLKSKDEWEGRNPVSYWNEDDYKDIDFSKLQFTSLEEIPKGINIAEAKKGLSIGLGVPESAIEITIRI